MEEQEVSTDEVATAVAGLREFADFIEANPRFVGALRPPRFLLYVDDPDEFTTLVSQLGGKREKGADDDYFGVSRFFASVELYVYTTREQVCEAKVIGTEKVTVPDPNAPLVEIERDIVEWTCSPVLAKTVAA